MDYVTHLQNRANIPNAIFLRFINHYENESDDLFVFFEGNDDASYYLPEIRRKYIKKFDGKIYTYKCNGKGNVNIVYDQILKKVKKDSGRTLFIVDKDLDDFLNIEPITNFKNYYITEYYSFENNLINDGMLESFWTDILHLDSDDSRLYVYLQLFKKYIDSINKRLMLIMAWVLCNRRNGIRPLLNNIKLEKLSLVQYEMSLNEGHISKMK